MPYVGWLIFAYRYHFLDGVNLLIHEAGHMVFAFLGDTLGLLGGTILQLLAPAVFTGSFLRRRMTFEAAVCGIWLAESLMYTGRYIGDARTLRLPILGEIHDWNELLIRGGMLEHAEVLGSAVHIAASLLALAALGVAAQQVLTRPATS